MKVYFRSLLVYVRDISYSWSLKQYGYQHIKYDYKFKFIGFISGYYITITCIVVQLLAYLFSIENGDYLRSLSFINTIVIGLVFVILPLWFIGQFLLYKISHIPIEITPKDKVYKKLLKFWIGFILGWVCTGIFGMAIPIYLRGGEVRIVNLELNKGEKIKTIEYFSIINRE